jgi:hypothetical protein
VGGGRDHEVSLGVLRSATIHCGVPKGLLDEDLGDEDTG